MGSVPGGSSRRQSKAKAKKVEKPTIKDVILLPVPQMSAVPRGRIREELYVRKLVGTAVEIYGDLLEEEMVSLSQTLFSAKIATIHDAKKFDSVRIVGNRIVEPQVSRRLDGKMIKHIAGQGPIYLRCCQKIETDFNWIDGTNNEATSEEDTDTELELSAFPMKSEAGNIQDDKEEIVQLSSTIAMASTSNACLEIPTANIQPFSNYFPCQVVDVDQYFKTEEAKVGSGVLCPACNSMFSLEDIELYADLCCERNMPIEDCTYSNLMLEMQRNSATGNPEREIAISEEDVVESPCNIEAILKDIVNRVDKKTVRIDVRRKYLWDDYLEAQNRPWVKKEYGLKVVFLGEPAVDDGGPKREFFTGMCVFFSI